MNTGRHGPSMFVQLGIVSIGPTGSRSVETGVGSH